MNSTENKPYLSVSRIRRYLDCPENYRRKYILNEPTKTTSALVLGKAWHSAIEYNLRPKILSGNDLPLDEVQGKFVEEFDKFMRDENLIFRKGEDINSLRKLGLLITTTHHLELAPKLQPKYVEQEFRVSLGDDFPFDLYGFWDLIEQDGTIVDHKSYTRLPSIQSVHRDLQFTLYALAYRIKFQEIEPGLRMDCLVKHKDIPQAIQFHTNRDHDHMRQALSDLTLWGEAIARETFYPNPNSPICSQWRCDFWESCRGGKIRWENI